MGVFMLLPKLQKTQFHRYGCFITGSELLLKMTVAEKRNNQRSLIEKLQQGFRFLYYIKVGLNYLP